MSATTPSSPQRAACGPGNQAGVGRIWCRALSLTQCMKGHDIQGLQIIACASSPHVWHV